MQVVYCVFILIFEVLIIQLSPSIEFNWQHIKKRMHLRSSLSTENTSQLAIALLAKGLNCGKKNQREFNSSDQEGHNRLARCFLCCIPQGRDLSLQHSICHLSKSILHKAQGKGQFYFNYFRIQFEAHRQTPLPIYSTK